MVLLRVDSLWTGTGVTGGGITQLFFNNAAGAAQACADAVQDFWDAIVTNMSTSVSVSTDTSVMYFNETDGELLGVLPVTSLGATPGVVTGHMLPRASQGLIKWSTPEIVNNRVLRGRTFLPGLMEDANEGSGVPNAAIKSVVDAAAAALVTDATAQLAIWHRPVVAHDDVPASAGAYGIVNDGTMWDEWAVLRSRRD